VRDFVVFAKAGDVPGMVHSCADLISALHVDPAAKRRGIDPRLSLEAKAAIAERHATARLHVLAFNMDARRFSAEHGWNETRIPAGESSARPDESSSCARRCAR
jgi:GNAT superfamily N-acetyltransferase